MRFKLNGIKDIRIKNDAKSGLFSIVALHESDQPAIGGCRVLSHNDFQLAFDDVCLLACAMYYKAKLHNLPYGGGKSVILAPNLNNRKVWLKAFAKFVNEFNGKYITAIDSGSTPKDMEYIKQFTPYVLSTSNQPNTSLATATGVFNSIKAAVHFVYSQNLQEKTIVIQGLGSVGYELAKLLLQSGAIVHGYDKNTLNMNKALNIGVRPLSADNFITHPCDVFSPCALGGAIDSKNINKIKTSIICGAANNPIDTPSQLTPLLHERGIIYIPDFLSNAGGLIYVSQLYKGSPLESINKTIDNLYDKTLSILERSSKLNQTPFETVLDSLNTEAISNPIR